MSRVREAKITIPCSIDQKAEVERKSQEQGLSTANYLRKLLGWPLEQQGERKDLAMRERQSSKHMTDAGKQPKRNTK